MTASKQGPAGSTASGHRPEPAAEPAPERLSETLTEFLARGGSQRVYDVVIVGSGYGGSMAAHALAAAATDPDPEKWPQVLLLERGREFKAGDFPSRFGDLPGELRINHQESGEVKGHEGLFDIRLGPDVVAMVGNGLGGGSLINAGVMLEPEPADIDAAPGAPPHRHTLVKLLQDLKRDLVFRRATRLLGGQVKREGEWVRNDVSRLPRPGDMRFELPKAQALHELADRRGESAQAMGVTVAWDAQRNLDQAPLNACNQCGDCMTGCNVGAKNSLDRSLLYAAKRRLGERLSIVTCASIGSVAQARAEASAPPKAVPGWLLRAYHTSTALQQREIGQSNPDSGRGSLYLYGRRVVLAAGTLGSPEILLRSRSDRLQFSARLGESFSGNGDNIAAIHGLPKDVHGGADERQQPGERGVGPTTTARVTLRGAFRPFQVEEFAVPGAVKRLFDEMVTTGHALSQLSEADGSQHSPADKDPLAVDPAAMQKTLLVGLVGHDSADGSLRLAQPLRPRDAAPALGALRIHWPQARRGAEFEAAHNRLRCFVEGKPNGANAGSPRLVANPLWRLLPEGIEDLVSQPRGPVLTVHPLGGCRIGSDADQGVVDTLGRVFDTRAGRRNKAFESLLVLDGSIIGSSLGVNPALSIAALALNAMDHHVVTWALGQPTHNPETDPEQEPVDGRLRPAPPSPSTRPPDDAPALPSDTRVSVSERLWGRVNLLSGSGGLQTWVVELTLAFRAQAVSTLAGRVREPMRLKPEDSRLRLYKAEQWDEFLLKAADDGERAQFAEIEASLCGSLRFFHRQASGPWRRKLRGLWAYGLNRGLRDFWQRSHEPARHDEQRENCLSILSDGGDFLNLASHNGQRRLFEYELHIDQILTPSATATALLKAGDKLAGHKLLGYARRASPWTQLTEMHLTRFPGLPPDERPKLTLDARFLAKQGKPLLHIEQQHDHASALADLMAFGMYFARVLLDTHLWSFRKPDRRELREPYRLPAGILGLPAPEITTLVVDRRRDDSAAPDEPVCIRLTRYPRPKPRPHDVSAQARDGSALAPRNPLVMLHGYSASGTTFTHPSLGDDSAAAWFWRAGREVWVVDLRTSCGLSSARQPWAMEQPALVDIPAALLHIRNATGRKVDVLAHCIGGVMLGMALLTDAAWVRSNVQELGSETWLTSEHFGVLSAFNGDPNGEMPGAKRAVHPTVARVILSQKGPVLRYTDANVLRAYVLQFARRWLLPQNFSFQASRDPGVAEQLLDRFLSSLPYKAADFDVENPLWPCARTEWVGSRHRLDALFGRVFTAANLRPATLDAIDDLFGPINLDTVAQTIHFARSETITSQHGRGEFVTRKRLRERWAGIDTLVLHGQDNGMVDPHTHHLLTEQLLAAGVPVHPLPPIAGAGHQDCLIGTGAPAIFEQVEAFLAGRTTAQAALPDMAPMVCSAPWIGPRLAPVHGGVQVAAMSRSEQGSATLWLVPVRRNGGPAAAPQFELLQGVAHPWWPAAEALPSRHWHRVAPDLQHPPQGAPAEVGWLALFVYATHETIARAARMAVSPPPTPDQSSRQAEPGSAVRPRLGDDVFPLTNRAGRSWPEFLADRQALRQAHAASNLAAPDDEVVDAVFYWFYGESPAAHRSCFVSLQCVQRAADLHTATLPQPGFQFAVASCQYPHGLFDRVPAIASLQALADDQGPVQMALMVGDQIYADATAGLVDPTRADELYELPHERAFRQTGMRAVMQRMPVFMMLDDHELFDNWQQLPISMPQRSRRVHRLRERIADARRDGVAAYMKYQRMADSARARRPPMDQQFTAGGLPFFLLDTRSGRRRGSPSAGDAGGLIVSARRMQRLRHWLTEHADTVKFVVTPAMLLPRLAEVVGRPGNACRADAWDGFPDSLGEVLRHIGDPDAPIRNTVFLSGDAHHSLVTEAWLGAAGVKLVSVHCSALYAPYPFANGRPRDLAGADAGQGLGTSLSLTVQGAAQGDGYAVLEVVGQGQHAMLHIRFEKADGSASVVHMLALA